MVLFKKKNESDLKDRHFTWALVLCMIYCVGAFGSLLAGVIGLISICIQPAEQIEVISTASGLRFDLLIGYAQLGRETMPIAADVSEIDGKLFAVTFLILGILVYDLPLCFIAWKSYRILHTMEHSWSPFVPEIAGHIRWIGRISIVRGLLSRLIMQVGMSLVIEHRFYFEAEGDTNAFEMPWILAGVVILLVSDIFKKGCVLQKEVDETL